MESTRRASTRAVVPMEDHRTACSSLGRAAAIRATRIQACTMADQLRCAVHIIKLSLQRTSDLCRPAAVMIIVVAVHHNHLATRTGTTAARTIALTRTSTRQSSPRREMMHDRVILTVQEAASRADAMVLQLITWTDPAQAPSTSSMMVRAARTTSTNATAAEARPTTTLARRPCCLALRRAPLTLPALPGIMRRTKMAPTTSRCRGRLSREQRRHRLRRATTMLTT